MLLPFKEINNFCVLLKSEFELSLLFSDSDMSKSLFVFMLFVVVWVKRMGDDDDDDDPREGRVVDRI